MKRKIYETLLEWKNNEDKIPLMLLGARQVGKTYILNEFCQNEFKNYFYINLFEDSEILELYKTNASSNDKFFELKLLLNFDIEKENTILFFDEIQESEELISELKYFCERHNNLRIVCAGSLLGVKLKRFKKSFPVGKVKLLDMYPMDFEEFLIANNQELLLNKIKECYKENKPMLEPTHKLALKLYRYYLVSGGMPKVVNHMISINEELINFDDSILKGIIESYIKDMKKYVTSPSETIKIEKIYKSIPIQLANKSNKFQYSIVEKGAKSRDYELPLDWLVASNIVSVSESVSLPEIPLKGFVKNDIFKVFINDVGLLRTLLEISPKDMYLDNLSLFKGSIVENYVANQLTINGYSLYYWQSSGKAEIDFLLYTNDGIIPIEVKANDNTQSKSLNVYIDKFNPKYSIRISSKNFGYNKDNKIKSIPLYAVFCIKE